MEIEIRDLCMTYGKGKMALDHINADMRTPCLIGLVGPNGAGKSTLMKLLVASLMQTAGTIAIDGKPIRQQEKHLKSRLGYLPQDFGLYDELTVAQFLGYMAAVKGINGRRTKQSIEAAMADANLLEKRNLRIRTLSGGQKQRVGIAQALMGDPALLILDEPTVGLDPEERVNFRNLFSRISRGRIVILSTHIIDDVQSVCNRLIVLNRGRILFDGRPEALIRQSEGHVGIFEEQNSPTGFPEDENFKVTSRLYTANGLLCRIVGETLPRYVQLTEPSLEDAYMYLMAKEEAGCEIVKVNL